MAFKCNVLYYRSAVCNRIERQCRDLGHAHRKGVNHRGLCGIRLLLHLRRELLVAATATSHAAAARIVASQRAGQRCTNIN